ncbi:TPA: hypothetical protein U1C28_001992 [Streptococcus suis]|uniref:hypothetical protein n=1 Tax=Streptococcus sp. A18 TaxID=3373125 RepID=UPI002AA3594F|nr:hypothetical protein [Streptococcus suis]HEM3608902.1 hypothetical protein [Streptococcus suis]HEM3647277.1 hypothetical protein [Streptococcus suis]HEM3711742.1 hypothetical protein [Streptococcus suis]
MGVEMYLGQSDYQAGTASSVLSNRISAYKSIQTSLQSFINTGNLQGLTYQSAKNYSSQILIPLIQGCILLDEAVKEACAKLPREYRSQVDSIDLREDELREKIRQAGMMASRYEYLSSLERQKDKPNWSRESDLSLTARRYMEVERRLQEKLQKLLAFNSQSAQYFASAEPLLASVQQGLNQCRTSWDARTQSFIIPDKKALSWVKDINNKWKKRVDIVDIGIDYLIKPDFISKGAGAIHPYAKTTYLMGKSFMSAISKDYKKSGFMKYGKLGNIANDDLNTAWRSMKKFAKAKNWKWYKNLGSKWKKGSFNQFLNTVNHSATSKVANFKVFGKYPVKNINSMLGKITDPIKTYGTKLFKSVTKSKLASKLKFLGKATKTLGWVTMVADVSITSIREYNDKNSRSYGSVGKSLIHAGVAQLKSAGPIEGAMAGAAIGGPIAPITATIGFIAGTANTVWGVVSPNTKNAVYSWVQNGLDNGYDAVKNGLGKAVKGTWNTVASWFGGGLKHA